MTKKLLLLTIAVFVFSAVSFAQIPDGYYDSAEGLTGDDLKTALHKIIKGHVEYPYTSGSTDTWDILKEADRDPDNADNVILIYSGLSVDAEQEYNNGDGWTREHVWAKSHGDFDTDPPAGTDAHNLKPCYNSVNSSRSNKDFDNGGDIYSFTYNNETIVTECFSTNVSWEPRDAVKGDVARIMFYMTVRYEGEDGNPDLEMVDYTPSSGPFFGRMSTLLKWHNQDPVDDFERTRNEAVYGFQQNRNPFIDHPEYVNSIWVETAVASNQENQIAVFPNPAKNSVSINTQGIISNVTIYNVIGQPVKNIQQSHFSISELPSGQYFVEVTTDKKKEIKSLIIAR